MVEKDDGYHVKSNDNGLDLDYNFKLETYRKTRLPVFTLRSITVRTKGGVIVCFEASTIIYRKWADPMTKPLQGQDFKRMADLLKGRNNGKVK